MATADSHAFVEVSIGSERSFGLVFAGVFALIGFYPLLSAEPPRVWGLVIATGFLLAAMIYPRCLRAPNRAWFALGLLLGRLINPLVMLVIYVVAVLPTGLVLKLLGKDLLRLKPDPRARSYWIERNPPGPPAESMENQF